MARRDCRSSISPNDHVTPCKAHVEACGLCHPTTTAVPCRGSSPAHVHVAACCGFESVTHGVSRVTGSTSSCPYNREACSWIDSSFAASPRHVLFRVLQRTCGPVRLSDRSKSHRACSHPPNQCCRRQQKVAQKKHHSHIASTPVQPERMRRPPAKTSRSPSGTRATSQSYLAVFARHPTFKIDG